MVRPIGEGAGFQNYHVGEPHPPWPDDIIKTRGDLEKLLNEIKERLRKGLDVNKDEMDKLRDLMGDLRKEEEKVRDTPLDYFQMDQLAQARGFYDSIEQAWKDRAKHPLSYSESIRIELYELIKRISV